MSVEGIRSSDAISALAALYPTLLQSAAIYRRRFGVESLSAEDLVHEAAIRWLSSRRRFISADAMFVWMAKCMKGLAFDAAHRGTDALDQRPLSLEEGIQ